MARFVAAAASAVGECPPRGKTRLVLLLLLGVSLLFMLGGDEEQASAGGAAAMLPEPARLRGDEPSGEAQPGLPTPHLELGFVAESQSVESFPR